MNQPGQVRVGSFAAVRMITAADLGYPTSEDYFNGNSAVIQPWGHCNLPNKESIFFCTEVTIIWRASASFGIISVLRLCASKFSDEN